MEVTMARRGENIYKRSDGRWEGRYIISRDSSGKAVYRSVYAPTYTEVKDKLQKCRLGNIVYCKTNTIPPFDLLANSWLSTVKIKCRISTYNKYKNLYNCYIYPELYNIGIDKIDILKIQNILNMNDQLSSKTQNDILFVIRQILNYAEINGCQSCLNIKNISIHQEICETNFLSLDEQNKFTDYLLSEPDLCKIGVYLCLFTGLRIGELCALKRGDISFETEIISIRKTMQRVQIENESARTKVIISEPKSRKSVRDIPLPTPLIDIIYNWYNGMKLDDYILTGSSDKFIEPRLLEYHFKQYIRACGIKNVNFHALRHTFATRCVEMGFDVKTLSEILGHVNVNITLNRYVHSSMELKRKNMERLYEIM